MLNCVFQEFIIVSTPEITREAGRGGGGGGCKLHQYLVIGEPSRIPCLGQHPQFYFPVEGKG